MPVAAEVRVQDVQHLRLGAWPHDTSLFTAGLVRLHAGDRRRLRLPLSPDLRQTVGREGSGAAAAAAAGVVSHGLVGPDGRHVPAGAGAPAAVAPSRQSALR